ncbi:MAG: ABC transporter permease [Williamsia sp.]|nr:ABC transporter permease [Williamsia sp.]
MFKNYFKIAIRTLLRNKLYTAINIAGLTFGLSCFLLTGLYLFDELTFDQQHSRASRIYRVIENKNDNGESTAIAAAGYKLSEESKRSIAGVENATRFQRTGRANILNPENPSVFFQETVTIADENLLKIFDFPLVAGDKSTALKEPYSIIINEDLALRLFNKTDVVGKLLQFSHLQAPLKITGVLKNPSRNSSFDFSSVMSESSDYNSEFFKQVQATDWLSNNFTTYVLLKPGTNEKTVATEISKLVHASYKAPAGTLFSFRLQPLTDVHLDSKDIVDGARNSNVEAISQGNPLYIKIFSFIALFVLLIAGINYMNLTTASASGRLKEIGVRKAVGALKSNLVRQFLFESLVVTLISFFLSVGVVNVLFPSFNQFLDKHLSLGFSTDYRAWLYAISFAVLIGFLSGSYPALMLSRYQPVSLLKRLKSRSSGDLSLRKGLVVFQFTVSVVIIITTIVLIMQVRYMNHTDLGFNKDLLVVIDVNTGKARTNFEAVKTEMARLAAVKGVSATSRVPGEWKTYRTVKIKSSGSIPDEKQAYLFGADKDFLETFEIKLLKGRNFDQPSDSNTVMLNETAARMLGINEPAGQPVQIPSYSRGEAFRPVYPNKIPFAPTVIGIVKDFHFQTLHDKIEPLVLAYNNNPIHDIDYYTVRIVPADIQGTLNQLKQIMVNNDKNDPFEYHFLDQQLALFYVDDARRQTILVWIAVATIFIACLGLFGLATYSAEQRVKEIGLRKVLGATVLNLTALLSKDFLKLVFIANGIAFPIAWWASSKWLQEYAYHVNVQWWIFAVAGIAACLCALFTVSYQAIRAAIANPVKSLRAE